MTQRIAIILARVVSRWPAMCVAGAMLAAAILALGIPRLKFETGQDTLLNPSSKIARDNARFQAQFGGDPLLVLFETPEDGPPIAQLFTPENRATLARLKADLDASGKFQGVISPLDVLGLAKTTIQQRMVSEPAKLVRDEQRATDEARADSAARGESLVQQDAAAAAAKQAVDDAFQKSFGADAVRLLATADQSLENPAFIDFLLYDADGNIRAELGGIFPDDHHALLVARLAGNLSIDDAALAAGDVQTEMREYPFGGVSTLVSGPPLLIKEINDTMRSAFVVMAIIAVVIMVLVLSLIFRARWRLLSLPAVVVGCVAAFGLMGFVGIPLTMVTISGLPILIGLGVDFAIQIHSRIEEETFGTDSAESGVERTFVRLGPALATAAFAACIGFLVLHLSDVPMIRDFGSMLAVGAIIVFATSLTLVSGVLFLRERTRLGERPTRRPMPRARFEVERLVGGLTARAVGRLLPIALVAVVVAAGGLFVSRKIATETDPEKMVPSGSKVLVDLHHVADVAGSTGELNLLIEMEGDRRVTDQDVLDWMLAFEQGQRADHPALHQSNSVASFTQQVSGDAPTTASAESALAIAPKAIVDSVVNGDRTMASITFALDDSLTLGDQRVLTEELVREASPPDGVAVAPAGIAVVGIASLDAISANRDLMSLVALIAILLVLLALFRNPLRAVAPLLPVVLALGASAMILYTMGVDYSPLTSISGPLIIAMGTEFNLLLMARYFEERAAGAEARAAMAAASLRIGRAIAASGLTVMGGFAVLAFSDFPLLDNFGRVTALNVGLSLLSTLILLPPLLVWADEEHNWRPLPDALPE